MSTLIDAALCKSSRLRAIHEAENIRQRVVLGRIYQAFGHLMDDELKRKMKPYSRKARKP